MIKRILYAIRQGWAYRKSLKRFLSQPQLQLERLEHLTQDVIEAANIAVVALDFDGVLAPHDADEPSMEAQQWLQRLSIWIGEQRIAILTNKAKPERLRYFQQHFPGIQVVTGVAKKPYPDGIWEIANYREIDPSRILLIDDRLLTGMLATCLAPCQARYFIKPISNYRAHCVLELFFNLLRQGERLLIKAIG